MASTEEIDKLIRSDPSKALKELKAMPMGERASTNWNTLCETAILGGNLEVANTILRLNDVEPLDMDLTNIQNFYHSNNTKSLISSELLVLYRDLVKDQKIDYCNEISATTTKLKIMAAEKLGELISDEKIKRALTDPKNENLDRTIQEAEKWLASPKNHKDLTKTKTYEEYKAASDTAKELVTAIVKFRRREIDLADFIQETNQSLKHPRNACLNENQGFRGILNDIGNAINRFIGKVKAWQEGKLDEFKERKVEVMGFKARLENIKNSVEDLPLTEDLPPVSAPKR